jgi:hypothetical protein
MARLPAAVPPILAKLARGGKGWRGVDEYASSKPGAQILASTFASADARGRAREFARVRALRPNLQRALDHFSLSASPGVGRLTDQQWKEAAATFIKELGYPGDTPLHMVRHSDTDHDHCHLILSRISVGGSIHSDSNLARRMVPAAAAAAAKLNLTPTPPSPDRARAPRKTDRSERAQRRAERRGTPPSRPVDLLEAARAALQLQPRSWAELQKELDALGVEAELVIQSTGRVQGWKLRPHGSQEWLKATEIHRSLSWKQVEKVLDRASAQANPPPPAPRPAKPPPESSPTPALTPKMSDKPTTQSKPQLSDRSPMENPALPPAQPDLDTLMAPAGPPSSVSPAPALVSADTGAAQAPAATAPKTPAPAFSNEEIDHWRELCRKNLEKIPTETLEAYRDTLDDIQPDPDMVAAIRRLMEIIRNLVYSLIKAITLGRFTPAIDIDAEGRPMAEGQRNVLRALIDRELDARAEAQPRPGHEVENAQGRAERALQKARRREAETRAERDDPRGHHLHRVKSDAVHAAGMPAAQKRVFQAETKLAALQTSPLPTGLGALLRGDAQKREKDIAEAREGLRVAQKEYQEVSARVQAETDLGMAQVMASLGRIGKAVEGLEARLQRLEREQAASRRQAAAQRRWQERERPDSEDEQERRRQGYDRQR